MNSDEQAIQPAQPDAPASPPAADGGGLATAAEVEQLADKLSACADALHERVMREVRSYNGKAVPAKVQDALRALLDDEQVLRERAGGLYADAARCIVGTLGQSQKHLVALTTDAAEKIRKITRIGDSMGLVARLLGLAAAVATGQPAPIVLALEGIKQQLDTIASRNAPPKPPA
jgi:hypothetical protein